MRIWNGRRSSVPIFGRTPASTLSSSKSTTSSSAPSTSTTGPTIFVTSSPMSSPFVDSPTTCSVNSPSDSESTHTPSSGRTIVSRACDWTFRRIAYFVADHPKRILILILLFSTVCSVKILFTEQEDDLKTGYTPNNARSNFEFDQYSRFYDNVGGEPLSVVVFVQSADNGTMARLDRLNRTVDLLDDLGTNFRLAGQSFYEFCTDFCDLNEPIRQFRNGLLVNQHAANWTLDSSELRDRIELTFPFMRILGRRLDLSPNFFGVQTFSSVERQRVAGFGSNVEFLKLIVLQFRADRPANATKSDVVKWEQSITNYLNRDYTNPDLKTMALTVTLARDEIVRTGMTLFPFLSVGFLIMSGFSVGSVFLSAFYYDQWTKHKLTMAVWACVCPLLATSTALGFLFWFGFRFGTILAVVPFLVMAIGVDDAFIMIHSWQRLCSAESRRRVVGLMGRNELRERTAEMLVDVGPSITITSVTNLLAFGVGTAWSPTPEIQLFCAGNAVAIFFDYLYQLFLYVPVVVLVGEVEESNLKTRRIEKPGVSFWPKSTAERRRTSLHKQTSAFMSNYCAWLSNRFTSVFVILTLFVYWAVSFHGMRTFAPRITPSKLFLADSIINDINRLRDSSILPGYTAISVFVNNASNLADPHRRQRAEQLIRDFETRPENLGAEYTHFWLRDYDRFMQNALEDEFLVDNEVEDDAGLKGKFGFTRQQMSTFLNWSEYRHWNGFMRFDPRSGELTKFFAIVAFHGPQMVAWESRGRLLNEWRQIVDRYPDLDAFVWVDEAQFLDQIETLVPVSIQSSVATLICMAFVCVVFMTNLFTLTVATIAMVSICLGVFGFLSYWGVDLDPISLCVLLMSIGFSVDFPAHVTFHYYRLGKESSGRMDPEERIFHALVAIGYPLVQCGLSTILFVTCLLFVDTYMSEVFVKTMFLVVSLGLIHGLLFVPAMLCAFSRLHSLVLKLSTITRMSKLKNGMVHRIKRVVPLRSRGSSSIKRTVNFSS